MTYDAVTFVDGIQNCVLLTLKHWVDTETAANIARKLSHDYKTVIQIFMYNQRVLTVSTP